MKRFGSTIMLTLLVLVCVAARVNGQIQVRDMNGAWEKGPEENRMIRINTEKHFSVGIYNLNDKTFVGTYGGSWRLEGNSYIEVLEFNTVNPELIGKEEIGWCLGYYRKGYGWRASQDEPWCTENDEDLIGHPFSMDSLQLRNKRIFWHRWRYLYF
jgi:hypothetical protein